jgi:hypothetical protein
MSRYLADVPLQETAAIFLAGQAPLSDVYFLVQAFYFS